MARTVAGAQCHPCAPQIGGQLLSGARGLLVVVVDCVLLVQRGQRLGLLVGHVVGQRLGLLVGHVVGQHLGLLVGHVAGAALGACLWVMWRGQRLGPALGAEPLPLLSPFMGVGPLSHPFILFAFSFSCLVTWRFSCAFGSLRSSAWHLVDVLCESFYS